MELALGTVQFGLRYGVSARKQLLPDGDIRKILELAFRRGVTILDTAPVYGDIESRLGSLCEGLEFRIVSKIPPLPDALDHMMAAELAVESAQASRKRLGRKLHALLFHRAADLIGPRGDAVWESIVKWAKTENVLVGASGYDVIAMRSLFEMRRISIAQLPGSALDQRIDRIMSELSPKPEVHLRSVFLQGLLLLPVANAVKLVPAANSALERWQQWLTSRGMSPLQGALSVVKAFEDIAACVVGIDNINQLTEITNTWREVQPISARELACEDSQVIDPRLWGDREQ